jgi:fatty-acyl-CoA synthase
MNLSSWIERRADLSPDRPVIRFEGETIAWAQFFEGVRSIARALRDGLGVEPGDRVAHLGYNTPFYLALLFACARVGAMLVPLNWRLAAPEHAYIVADAVPRVLIHDAAFAGRVAELATAGALNGVATVAIETDVPALAADAPAVADAASGIGYDAPALIVYTSGTTGRPKGAVLTQEALFWNAVNGTAMHDMTSADRVLTTLPMFHVGGLNIQTLPALHAGATVILHRRFDPDATLRAIAEDRPSLTVLVPAQMAALIGHPAWPAADLSSLRLVATGSMIVPVSLIEAFHARGVPVTQVYGSTETAPIAVALPIADVARKIGSCGKPALHCEIRVVGRDGEETPAGASGEILVRGRNVMREYWRDAEATRAALDDAGWFATGDIGHLDDEGYLYVDERKKDVIISGGENIYPAELEAILAEAAAIAEAVVVARPDPRWGEVPVVVCVARDGGGGTEMIGREAILALFEGRIARYKHPRDVVYLEALPKNALGKIMKYELRRIVAEAAAAAAASAG